MKKVILAALISLLVFSCTKETDAVEVKTESKVFIRAVAVDVDGTQTYSPVIMLK